MKYFRFDIFLRFIEESLISLSLAVTSNAENVHVEMIPHQVAGAVRGTLGEMVGFRSEFAKGIQVYPGI